MTQGINSWARAYIADQMAEEFCGRHGLPEGNLHVIEANGRFWAQLNARSKQRWLYCPVPGLPKDPAFLLETVEGIALWLVEQAKQLPDVPKERRVHKLSDGSYFVPGITKETP